MLKELWNKVHSPKKPETEVIITIEPLRGGIDRDFSKIHLVFTVQGPKGRVDYKMPISGHLLKGEYPITYYWGSNDITPPGRIDDELAEYLLEQGNHALLAQLVYNQYEDMV